MGLDWSQVSLSGYVEAIEARADAENPSKPEPSEFIRKLVNG